MFQKVLYIDRMSKNPSADNRKHLENILLKQALTVICALDCKDVTSETDILAVFSAVVFLS